LKLDFFPTTCAMTIPNPFILGYTTAACGKLVKWPAERPLGNAAARETNSIATRQGL
jgi:hypothetical protein